MNTIFCESDCMTWFQTHCWTIVQDCDVGTAYMLPISKGVFTVTATHVTTI
jgi:hypothetical protein